MAKSQLELPQCHSHKRFLPVSDELSLWWAIRFRFPSPQTSCCHLLNSIVFYRSNCLPVSLRLFRLVILCLTCNIHDYCWGKATRCYTKHLQYTDTLTRYSISYLFIQWLYWRKNLSKKYSLSLKCYSLLTLKRYIYLSKFLSNNYTTPQGNSRLIEFLSRTWMEPRAYSCVTTMASTLSKEAVFSRSSQHPPIKLQWEHKIVMCK